MKGLEDYQAILEIERPKVQFWFVFRWILLIVIPILLLKGKTYHYPYQRAFDPYPYQSEEPRRISSYSWTRKAKDKHISIFQEALTQTKAFLLTNWRLGHLPCAKKSHSKFKPRLSKPLRLDQVQPIWSNYQVKGPKSIHNRVVQHLFNWVQSRPMFDEPKPTCTVPWQIE